MSQFDYDLFVIGAGSGGVRAARIAASHGARVAIAEEFRVGGTCVIRGCVPKKLYVLASRFADEFREAAGFGWTVPEAEFSWPKLVAAKEAEISRLERAYSANLEKSSVATFPSRAVITAPHTVQLDGGRSFTAGRILIATGGAPVKPNVPGVEFAITSNEVFDLPALPETMIIVGGGYIAVEFACLLQRLGVKVTLVYRGEAILRGFDDDVRRVLTEAMSAAGIEILIRTDLKHIEEDKAGGRRVTLTNGQTRHVGEIMVATGRKPNSAGLGLETVGVEINTAGAIAVDDQSRTTAPSSHWKSPRTSIGAGPLACVSCQRVTGSPLRRRIRQRWSARSLGCAGRPCCLKYDGAPTITRGCDANGRRTSAESCRCP